MKPNSKPSLPEIVTLSSLPKEARMVGSQPMTCLECEASYDLPLYDLPDGPVMSIARCPSCGERCNQVPQEVGA